MAKPVWLAWPIIQEAENDNENNGHGKPVTILHRASTRGPLPRVIIGEPPQLAAASPASATGILVRESLDQDGNGEHMHVLLHIPEHRRKAFRKLIKGRPGRNHLRRAGYGISYTETGKRRWGVGYMLKVAHPRDRKRDKAMWWAPPCPIYGWRIKTTMDLAPAARRRAEPAIKAKKRILGEKVRINRHVSLTTEMSPPGPIGSSPILEVPLTIPVATEIRPAFAS